MLEKQSHNKPQGKSQPGKSPGPAPGRSPVMLALIAALGLGAIAILPRLGQQPTQQQSVNPQAGAVTISQDDDQGSIHPYWGMSVSQQQFWWDATPTPATCDEHSCTVPKRTATQLYFRWFDNSENRWYYFQCPANYRGTFTGIPYANK